MPIFITFISRLPFCFSLWTLGSGTPHGGLPAGDRQVKGCSERRLQIKPLQYVDFSQDVSRLRCTQDYLT